ncbi:unnamed protein product [Caenorhabditis bovis]|uniref:Tetratricopeptide repeat protein n=1 Tax=Caenorhabditis bovis TaxID=2654633 RepID=A0A8S1E9I7_9PELO|nr:unnamed protein product [Caenorhabditis bovis]
MTSKTIQASKKIAAKDFDNVDRLFGTNQVQDGYDILKKRLDGGEKSAELLWRLARFCHERVGFADRKNRKELVLEGRKYGADAFAADSSNFQAARWAALMSGQSAEFLGIRERIDEGKKCKKYLDKALSIEPKDEGLLHLRGRWCYSVSNLGWFERRAASILFSGLPNSTIDDAIADFRAVYALNPKWPENLLYLGKSLLQKGNKAEAKKFLQEAVSIPPFNDIEREIIVEAQGLLSKC